MHKSELPYGALQSCCRYYRKSLLAVLARRQLELRLGVPAERFGTRSRRSQRTCGTPHDLDHILPVCWRFQTKRVAFLPPALALRLRGGHLRISKPGTDGTFSLRILPRLFHFLAWRRKPNSSQL